MLVNLEEILKIAQEKKIAIGAFNCPNLESLVAITDAAESLDLPVILQFAQCHEPLIPLKVIGPVMVEAAKRALVPICVHLDHGETLEYLKTALDIGFTGVMYDGSNLTYVDNMAATRRAVELAESYGASVEGELGSMGERVSASADFDENDDTKIYTDPGQAAIFVEETGICALACSFGTTHGLYIKEPKLDFDIIRKVRKNTGDIPVVMHGGSGVSAEDYALSIEAGVRKINYFTYMDKAGGRAAEEYIRNLGESDVAFFSSVSTAATDAMREDVKKAMKVFGGLS